MKPTLDSRGFTLTEMLVALAIGGLVSIFMFKTFMGSQQATQRVGDLIENRQNARTAIQLLERDLRMAGSGWSRAIVEGAFGGQPLRIRPITPGYGGSPAAQDTVGMIGAWDVVTTLSTGMSLKTSPLTVASVAGFATNDFCVITNGTNSHLFRVTGIKITSPYELYHATSSTYNAAGGHLNWPSAGYKANSHVYRVSRVSYFVDTTQTRLKLVRREANRPDQMVAFDVQQFKLWYHLEDGTVTRQPGDSVAIERLEPVVATRTLIAGREPLADSASTMIRPRSF